MIRLLLLLSLLILPSISWAEAGLPAVNVVTNPDGSQEYSVSLQILFIMTALTLLPAALMMMTAFTRIIVVLAILRQAIGLQQTPSNQILIGMALFLTLFIMTPTMNKINAVALQPYLNNKMTSLQAVEAAEKPMRDFMLAQTRKDDIALFVKLAGKEGKIQSLNTLPFTILMPAFVTSELKTAFQIGFMIFIPFLIVDMVVASVLMAMGMMMLSPVIISLPFKIMLFVMVDGWSMIMGTLAASFGM
ncbi:Flagellar biosynthetic protein FliP precursor [Marinomonas spartinae]|uniref:Flagellar biosynthetic protein FliP n=1 Tax=Marinomonas spartinae TaxID=1792290 RepID=A0A1A8TJM7_9GAMM|nr:Flagellar biosynthetic protein FliP precursor [Marinomonas spartinae]SBS32755.1 Flagellar biosynthetic protein FliP precursor [Marinomonas spartinae]